MKRIMFLSIFVLIAVVLIGCSNSQKQVSTENETSQPPAAEVVESAPGEAAINEVEQNSGADINVSMGETGENMSLPESFPDDVFPLPDDANIINVNENADANATSIIFKTGKNFEEAIAFCQDIMKGGTIAVEDKKDVSYFLMGDKGKYNIIITVNKYNGENISILMNVTPL